jgi:probable HAF family extracellular repeat protein
MFKSCFQRSLRFVSLLTLSTTSLLATLSGAEDEDFRSIKRTRTTPGEHHYSIEDLPDEIHLIIFSFLKQKDIPSAAGTCRRWQIFMDDNQLWKEYARRARIILKEDFFPERNYKALVREHCTFSFTDLGFLNGGTSSVAQGISADGSVTVGYADDRAALARPSAFRWTTEKGMESLGSLNRGRSLAQGISTDGSVIVGYADDRVAQNQARAFRWTAEKGMESLGTLNGGAGSWAHGISADGSVIVGYANDRAAQNQARAFRWTAEKGMELLGSLNGGRSAAQGVSFDGSVIVGEASDRTSPRQRIAFRWTTEKGMESVEKVLIDKSLLPAHWTLISVNAITPSGTVLIGVGEYNDRSTRTLTPTLTCAWRAVIPRVHLF